MGLIPELGGRDLPQNTHQARAVPQPSWPFPPPNLPGHELHPGTTRENGPWKELSSNLRDCLVREWLIRRMESALKRPRLQVLLHPAVCRSQERREPPWPPPGPISSPIHSKTPGFPLLVRLPSSLCSPPHPQACPSLSNPLPPPDAPHLLQQCGHTCLLPIPMGHVPYGLASATCTHRNGPGPLPEHQLPPSASTLLPTVNRLHSRAKRQASHTSPPQANPWSHPNQDSPPASLPTSQFQPLEPLLQPALLLHPTDHQDLLAQHL